MWDAICNWLAEEYPALILAVVVAVVVWCIAKFYYQRIEKNEREIAEVEKKVSELPCKAREEQYLRILGKLETISLALVAIKPSTLNALTIKQSPRQLNTYGKSLFDDCEGALFLEENKDFLLAEIEKRQPKTALDVEVLANEVLMLNLGMDIFNGLKNWVYNSPTRKLKTPEGEEVDHIVSMGDVCIVLSLPLRDMYLESHPELKTY